MDGELAQLERSIRQIEGVARALGLDPFPTRFEVVPAHIMYEFGAYGLPGRFSHWTHGKAYHQMKTRYDYGLSKIYELVINSNPCYGFLLETNTLLQNKLVAAHVIAHSDFFKHNAYFRPTSREMLESVSLNADRIRKYEFDHGSVEVEKFLDAVLAIQEHVDPHPYIRKAGKKEQDRSPRGEVETPYDDLWEKPKPGKKARAARVKTPPEPEKDLLLFILQQAPDLEEWQRDVISIVRSEMLYFLPQMQTKIMNEGWASYWHARIMRELELDDEEYTEFARLHASILTPARMHFNPYLVGMRIFEDLERRGGERGKELLFEVREMESDLSFIRNYLTEELVEELDLFVYQLEGQQWTITGKEWEKVRDTMVAGMVNSGFPYIVVEDGDYRGNRELFLRHAYDGQELDLDYSEKALRHVYTLWGRPVHLETVVEGRKIVLSYDGRTNSRSMG